MNRLVKQIRLLAFRAARGNDAELLARFVQRRDEEAFATLVERHGPLVRGVCRRWLAQEADVDDAFQATFLVFAQRAGSISRPERLGGWLHGVAWRTARCLRTRLLRQRQREVSNSNGASNICVYDAEPNDWARLVDEELRRLPEKYRLPVILCHLQGLTRRQAAVQLAIPEGTLSVRLARACVILRRRLLRRGVAPAIATVAALTPAADAALPPGLLQTTVTAAQVFLSHPDAPASLSASVLSLTRGVLHMLFLKRISAASALILLVFTVGTGLGLFLNSQVHRPVAAAQPPSDLPRPSNVRPAQQVPLRGASGKNEIHLILHAKPDGSDIDRIDIVEGRESLTAHSLEALGHYLRRLRAAEPTMTKSLVIEGSPALKFEWFIKVNELCTLAEFTTTLAVKPDGEENSSLPAKAGRAENSLLQPTAGKAENELLPSRAGKAENELLPSRPGRAENELLPGRPGGAGNRRTDRLGRPFELSGAIFGQDKTYDIAQSRGKLVIVYYWTTTYAGRHNDFDKLKRLQDEFGSRNLELVSVLLDEEVQRVNNDLNRFHKPGIHLYRPGGMQSPLATKHDVTKIPTIFLVGRDGNLIASGIPVDDLEDVLKKNIGERNWGEPGKQ
ncbi:MAG TPA: sigma-70 family RNA polymerase sigma factor [Gemmataceae bacterium]|jgi:RNA polymerase sigma factor (sigma-70 family)|nr:sigma-70 family RNA polymerase sigma factor [Gemmataceae bacterium]